MYTFVFNSNEFQFCSIMLHSVSCLCRYVLVNKLLTGLWESKQERLIRTSFRQQWVSMKEKHWDGDKWPKKWRNVSWDSSTVWLLAMTGTNVWRGKHWKRHVLKPTDVNPTFFLGERKASNALAHGHEREVVLHHRLVELALQTAECPEPE